MGILNFISVFIARVRGGDFLALVMCIGLIVLVMAVLAIIVNSAIERHRRRNPPPESTQYRR
jgi:hypothetical protein